MNKKIFKQTIFITALLFTSATFAQAATLSVSPSTANINEGETITATITLDTQGSNTDGVDVDLRYNPEVLEIQDTDPVTPGMQI